MIDEKKLIEELQSHIEKERTKCNQMAELGLDDSVVKYSHGEYCYVNALHLVQTQPKVGEWIPCSERMPKEKGTYLVTVKHFGVTFGRFTGQKDNLHFDSNVIAWQPLPEPYRKDVE